MNVPTPAAIKPVARAKGKSTPMAIAQAAAASDADLREVAAQSEDPAAADIAVQRLLARQQASAAV